jgi:hypothetical protein
MHHGGVLISGTAAGEIADPEAVKNFDGLHGCQFKLLSARRGGHDTWTWIRRLEWR